MRLVRTWPAGILPRACAGRQLMAASRLGEPSWPAFLTNGRKRRLSIHEGARRDTKKNHKKNEFLRHQVAPAEAFRIQTALGAPGLVCDRTPGMIAAAAYAARGVGLSVPWAYAHG